MARINLLPWRTERRKQREREFYMLLLAAGVSGLLALFALIGWMGARIDNQTQRNTYLTTEIKSLDKQIEEIKELDKTKSQLLTRKAIIEQLQSNRSQMVHLFDEMVKTVPDGVRLTSLKQAGDVLTLEGVAESNARVASYMRNIDTSPWMGRTDLRKIENKAGTKDVDKKMPYVFSLDVKLRRPEDAQTDTGIANADASAAPGVSGEAVTTPKPAADLGGQVNDAATKLSTPPPAETTTPQAPAPAPAAKDAEKGEKK